LSFAWKRYPLNLITNLQTASRAFSNVLLCLNLVQICRRLAHWYISVIRTVLDYCAVVWHHGLSKNQTESIGAIQRRALRIVYPITASMPYWAALHYADLPSLSVRRDKLCRDFFQKLHDPSSCIHHLLPPARDFDLTSRLRRASMYPTHRRRTNCYKSFIHHAVLKYQ